MQIKNYMKSWWSIVHLHCVYILAQMVGPNVISVLHNIISAPVQYSTCEGISIVGVFYQLLFTVAVDLCVAPHPSL